jgi:hypothetical protein
LFQKQPRQLDDEEEIVSLYYLFKIKFIQILIFIV